MISNVKSNIVYVNRGYLCRYEIFSTPDRILNQENVFLIKMQFYGHDAVTV